MPNPPTQEDIDKFNKQMGYEYIKTIEDLTCNKCDTKTTCPYAWDPYNTDGDCLADK